MSPTNQTLTQRPELLVTRPSEPGEEDGNTVQYIVERVQVNCVVEEDIKEDRAQYLSLLLIRVIPLLNKH